MSGAIVGINPYRLFESQRDRQIIGSYDRHTSIFCRMCGGDGGPGGGVRGVEVTGWSLIGVLMADEHDSR